MRLVYMTVLGVTCLVLPGTFQSRQVHAQEPAKLLLPWESTWKVRSDTQLDGVLKDPLETPESTMTMTVRNNRIVVTGKRTGIMTGEIVPGVDGGFPIVMFRGDPDKILNGPVIIYTGRLVEEGKIVGTWVNNQKSAGDFEFVMVKK